MQARHLAVSGQKRRFQKRVFCFFFSKTLQRRSLGNEPFQPSCSAPPPHLIIDDDDIKQIDSSQKRTQVKLHKYQAYIAYLMEFGYDLAIRPSLNVSQNPGFESLVGVFDCGNDDT